MALRLSAALRNALNEMGSFKHVMSNTVLKVYTGAQPASAEAAPTGTLLCTYSVSGAALTREVRSAGSVDLTGGASGSVNTITVNGIEIMGSATNFITDLATTAIAIADKINNNPFNLLFAASVSAVDKIDITAKPGLGALANGWVVASTTTTITKTDTNMAGGVSAVNGLQWGDSAAGTLVKHPTQVWQGTAAATGTAGYFRFEAAVTDAGALDAAEAVLRMDGAVATAGGELNMANTAMVLSAVQTVSSFSVTLPTA